MSVFDGIGDLLNDLIVGEGLGRTVTHWSVGRGANYNPATGMSTPAEDAYTMTAVVDDLTRALVESVAVVAGDLKLTIPAPAFTVAPTTKDRIVIDGASHAVLVVKSVGPGPVVYELQCRRA